MEKETHSKKQLHCIIIISVFIYNILDHFIRLSNTETSYLSPGLHRGSRKKIQFESQTNAIYASTFFQIQKNTMRPKLFHRT